MEKSCGPHESKGVFQWLDSLSRRSEKYKSRRDVVQWQLNILKDALTWGLEFKQPDKPSIMLAPYSLYSKSGYINKKN